jgi:hypothetical protein
MERLLSTIRAEKMFLFLLSDENLFSFASVSVAAFLLLARVPLL